MKIAVSSDGENVAAHFGRCSEYTVVDVEDGEIVKRERVQNPGHRPGFLPKFLSRMGVTHIITGGMGPRAQGLFTQYNIETIIGANGPVDEVIEKYLDGALVLGESKCNH
jgi:predicted Fe-Mo cluster-binding NifX family protein